MEALVVALSPGVVAQIILLSLGAFTLTQWLRYLRACNMLKRMPGEPGRLMPFLNGLDNLRRIKSYDTKDLSIGLFRMREDYWRKFEGDGIYYLWISLDGNALIHVYRPDLVEEVLKSPYFAEKSIAYSYLHDWLGNGLITSNGRKWKEQRRMLTPAFHFAILDQYEKTINEHSLSVVKEMLNASHGKKMKNVELSEWATDCTMAVLLETVMGLDLDDLQGGADADSREYIEALNETAYLHTKRMANPFSKFRFMLRHSSDEKRYLEAVDRLHAFSKKVIDKKIADFKEDPSKMEPRHGKKQPFMDLLIAMHLQGEKISIEEVMYQAATFMFAGHDTTGWGIAWILYQLGVHLDVQEKLHEELDQVFGEDRERLVTSEDLKQLRYLECVIKECQRLYPSVPFVGRRCTKDGAKIGDYEIPEGSTVALAMYWLHKHPAAFDEPERFNPDRFLVENARGRHPYAFIPFSAGPRNCIGQRFAQQEMKITLTNILRSLRVRSRRRLEDIDLAGELILRAKNGLYVDFEKR